MVKKVTQKELNEREAQQYRENMDAMTVSRFQAKVVLDETDFDDTNTLLDKIEEYMNGGTVTKREKLAWQEASFRRGSKMINKIGSELGLSTEEIDNIFLAADQVED